MSEQCIISAYIVVWSYFYMVKNILLKILFHCSQFLDSGLYCQNLFSVKFPVDKTVYNV